MINLVEQEWSMTLQVENVSETEVKGSILSNDRWSKAEGADGGKSDDLLIEIGETNE